MDTCWLETVSSVWSIYSTGASIILEQASEVVATLAPRVLVACRSQIVTTDAAGDSPLGRTVKRGSLTAATETLGKFDTRCLGVGHTFHG